MTLIGCALLVGSIYAGNRYLNRSLAEDLPAEGAGSTYTLSITATNGTVTKSPDKASYEAGEEVVLTATGANGFVFTEWSAGLRSAANPINVVIGTNTELPENGTIAINAGFAAGDYNPGTYTIESVSSTPNDQTKAIFPPASGTAPDKGAAFIQEETGHRVTRLTDLHADFPGYTTDYYHGYNNGYSTYTYENVTGRYMIMQNAVTDGTKAGLYLYDLTTNSKVKRLDIFCSAGSGRLDEANDVRWDLSGRPGTENTVYYQVNTGRGKVCKQDVVTDQASLLYDFNLNGTVPAEYTGTFGDDHMSQARNATYRALRAQNNGASKWIAGVVDLTTGTMLPGLIEVSDYHQDNRYIPPNYAGIDISPEGTWLTVGGWSDMMYNSCASAAPPPLRFYRISDLKNGITNQYVEIPTKKYGHNSWSHDASGNEIYIYQNDCTDSYAGFNPAANVETSFIRMPEMNGYSCLGVHLQRNDNPLLNGWLLMSTYSGASGSNWAHNQIFMVEMKPEVEHPRIWRVASNYSQPWPNCSSYDSNHYFAQGFANINFAGTRIYWGSNWNGTDNLETYKVDLPQNWHEVLTPTGSIDTLAFAIRLSGRAASLSELENASHASPLSCELLDESGNPLFTPQNFSATSTSNGTVTMTTATTPALRQLQNNPGTTYRLRLRPTGYLPQSISISDASFDTSPTVPLFYPGSFSGVSDKVQLADFSMLAAYYNGGNGTAGVLGAYGSRPRGTLLSEFAKLAARFNSQ